MQDQVKIRKQRQYRESDLQKKCVAWLRKNDKLVYKINNEGKRNAKQSILLHALGLTAGVPDLCVPMPRREYKGLYLEIKDGIKSELRDTQIWWGSQLIQQGYAVHVIRSYEEFLLIVNGYFS